MQYQDESEPANTRQNMFNLTLRLWAQKIEQTQRAHGIKLIKVLQVLIRGCRSNIDKESRELTRHFRTESGAIINMYYLHYSIEQHFYYEHELSVFHSFLRYQYVLSEEKKQVVSEYS